MVDSLWHTFAHTFTQTSIFSCLPLSICAFLFVSPANGGVSHAHSSLSVSVPHQQYICPEGATVKLMCKQAGALLDNHDSLRRPWLFTPHIDQQCTNQRPRAHSHGNHSLPPGVHYNGSKQSFWVILVNVTLADQGRYCCMVVEVDKKHTRKQETHSHIVLTITPRKGTIFVCYDSHVAEVEEVDFVVH